MAASPRIPAPQAGGLPCREPKLTPKGVDAVHPKTCWNCGLGGPHGSPADCIRDLRSALADAQFAEARLRTALRQRAERVTA